MAEQVPKRQSSRKAPYFLFLVAAVFFFFAAKNYSATQEKIETWQKTEATIVGFEEQRGATSTKGRQHSRKVYYPLFRFTAADSQVYTVRGSVGSNPPDYQQGETVEVLYSKAEPDKAQINSPKDLYLACGLLAAFGVMSAVFGFVLQRKLRTSQAKASI